MIADLADVAGVPRVTVSSVSPVMLRLLGMFSPAIRELAETSYQRDRPFVMDDSASRNTFGLTPTAWSEILDDIVRDYRRDS